MEGTAKDYGVVFCTDFYTDYSGRWLHVLGASAIIIMALGVNCFAIHRLYTRRRRFSVRQRAPLLALLHVIIIFVGLIFCLVIEVLIRHDIVNWDLPPDAQPQQIPLIRAISKYLLVY